MAIINDIVISSPMDAAKYYVFVEKMIRNGKTDLNFKNIQAKAFYSKNKKIFDKFYNKFTEHKLDMKNYIHFYVGHLTKQRKDFSEHFLSFKSLSLYVQELQIDTQYQKIYNNFVKSANNIAEDCIISGYSDAGSYLSHLVETNGLAKDVISGKISQYYLATIKNIGILIDRMDSISKDELKTISERTEKLRADAQNAFLRVRSKKVNPITYTNNIIKNKQQTGENKICVHS